MCPGSGIRYATWNRCLHPQGGSDEGSWQGLLAEQEGVKVQQYSHGILSNREGSNPGQAVVELVISVVTLTVTEVTEVGNTLTEVGGAGTGVEATESDFEVELIEDDIMLVEDDVMLTEDGVTAIEATVLVNEELKVMADMSK